MTAPILVVVVGLVAVVLFGALVVTTISYRRVGPGEALIVHAKSGARVSFTGAVVLPVVHRAEVLDVSVKPVRVTCRGVAAADERVDIEATFYVRVGGGKEDVLRVAGAVGCVRASSQHGVEALFLPKFVDALAGVAAKHSLAELRTDREEIKDEVIRALGTDLDGFVLEDIAIDRLEAGTLAAYDPDHRAPVDRAAADEIERLTAEVAALRERVTRLVDALAAAEVIDRAAV